MKEIRDDAKLMIKGYYRVCPRADGHGIPLSIACMDGLQQGVETFIDTIDQELKQTMVLTGTPNLTKVTPAILAAQEVPC